MSDKMCNECKRCDGDLCTYFDNYSDRESTIACILFEPKNPTVFDKITESVETLAQVSVCKLDEGVYYSHMIGSFYSTHAKAIAATVAELKKEYKNGN